MKSTKHTKSWADLVSDETKFSYSEIESKPKPAKRVRINYSLLFANKVFDILEPLHELGKLKKGDSFVIKFPTPFDGTSDALANNARSGLKKLSLEHEWLSDYTFVKTNDTSSIRVVRKYQNF